ncbi:MAG: hypothetical protein DRH12_02390 [Deltaproteobacteria bacterium]|nr:MAG: hypothetical protein DRH12_02390 [Deltaproteobacteria bacterium]
MGQKKNTWAVLDYIRVGLFGPPPNTIGGIDVTYRCNLTCKHCYFHKQQYHDELSLEQWAERFDRLQRNGFPFMICGWLGGEPLLRKSLIKMGKRYFKTNIIFTNGTIPLPSWPDVSFSVSVHGTEEYYYQITGAPQGSYERVKQNADRPDLDVVISCCITRVNFTCIEAMLEEWSKTHVKGIAFEFYTPMKGEGNELWLDWEERDRIIDQLISLRKTYGDFIWFTDRAYRLMRSDMAPSITRHCPFRRIGFAWDPMGRPKNPCQLGPLADCSRCGCILPFYCAILTNRRLLIGEFYDGVVYRIKRARLSSKIHGLPPVSQPR